VIADLAAALFLVTIVYVLVRPRSAAVDFVTAVSTGLTALVRTATDL